MSESRTVVVTEASSPVALATAARLAAGGHLVLMGGRRTQICEEFAARLRSGGGAVFAAHLDLTDPLSIDRFMQSADYLVGVADVLISSAGIADRSWVGAQHLVGQLVVPMIDNRRGDVVLLSPELIGASPAGADRMLDAWVSGLDAEFVAMVQTYQLDVAAVAREVCPGHRRFPIWNRLGYCLVDPAPAFDESP